MTTENKRRFAGSRALFVLATLVVLAPIASGSLGRALAGATDSEETDSFYREFAVFTEVLQHVRDRYVEATDLDRLFAGAFDGTADALDPTATYVPGEAVERYREARATGARRSGLEVVRERGILYVVGVAPGSAGAEADFETGDIISKLNGRSTRLTPLWEAQLLLAGSPGQKVSAEVLRRGETLELELTLEERDSDGLDLERRENADILRLSRFDVTLVDPLRELLTEGELAQGGRLILDLRSLAGGDPAAAFAMADLFVDGDLGSLRSRDETTEQFVSERPAVWSGPLVLLTNRGSQGASEIFAALLRQLAGAQLVGGNTFGHAGRTAQKTLSDGAQLFYTDAFFVAPDGTALDEALTPDLRVSGASRSLSEADLSLDELLIERAIGVLMELEAGAEKAA